MTMDQNRVGICLALLVAMQISVWADALPEPGDDIAGPSLGQQVLWYVPNRVMDFLDIFRIRVRLGPGLAANVRATDFAVFYAGKYDAVYVGAPGPRQDHLVRSPVGRESLRGFIIAGVDATDDTPHGPEYSASEFNVGAHILLVGAEVGIDPLAIWDFLGGFLLLDPNRDDYPRPAVARPDMTRAISLGEGEGIYRLDPKPERFDSIPERLDYLERNVRRRISEPLRATDAYFALSPEELIDPPQAQIRMKLFVELMQGRSFVLNVEPDVELDVAFPNIERRLRLFIETARADDLPERRLTETEERGVNVGLRKWFAAQYLSADAGVNARWTPDVFARLRWGRDFQLGEWGIRPTQQIVVNTDEVFASLSTLKTARWLGAMQGGFMMNSVSAKWSENDPDWNWSDSIVIARVNRLLDESQRGGTVAWDDTAHTTGVFYQILGDHHSILAQRFGIALRRPLYGQWVIGELRFGGQREMEAESKDSFFAHLGIDLLFWSTAQ